MYTKVTNSHIRLRGQTLLISPLMMTMLLQLLSLTTMGRAQGEERKRRERERENVGERVDVTKRMTMGACVACSESL